MSEEVSVAVLKRWISTGLRRFREEAGLEREDIARRIDCTPSYINDLESGRKLPDRPTVEVLFEHYGRPTADIEPFWLRVQQAGNERKAVPQPFTDMPPADIEQLPPSNERAVLLAALWIENKTNADVEWDATPQFAFQCLAPTPVTAPAAMVLPMALADPGPMASTINGLAHHLNTDAELRAAVVRPGTDYLGTGVVTEAWLNTAQQRVEVRVVIGVLATGEFFQVQRIRGHEPTVSFNQANMRGAEADLHAALTRLNSAFNAAY